MDRKQMASGETEEYELGKLRGMGKPKKKKPQHGAFYCELCRDLGGFEYMNADGERTGQVKPEGRYAVERCRNYAAHVEARKAAKTQPARAKGGKK